VRCRFGPTNDPERYRFVEGQGLFRGKSRCSLASTALKVLAYLTEHPEVWKSNEKIAHHVHGQDWAGDAATFAYTYISQIRRELADDNVDTAISSERGLGYRFNWKLLEDGPPALAVLPFTTRGSESEEFFADGLTDDLTDTLMKSFKVAAHGSAHQFRDDKNRDYRTIGDQLGVRFLVEGNIERSGNQIRVFAKLISAQNADVVWHGKYDKEVTDKFTIRDEIANAICKELRVKLSERRNLVPQHAPNTEAREAFSKGRHEFYKYSKVPSSLAAEHFEQATGLDARWAAPHSFLAYELFNSGILGWRRLAEVEQSARAYAEKALRLHDSEPMAHMVLGAIAGLQDYNWKKAEGHFKAAIGAESVPPEVHVGYSQYFLMPLGRFEEAIEQCNEAIDKDRLNALWRTRLAGALLCAEKYDSAIAEARNALSYDSKNYSAHYLVAMGYAFQGKVTEARESAEDAVNHGSAHDGTRGLLAGILAKSGDTQRADQMYAGLRTDYYEGRIMYHLICSEIDAVLHWYERNIELRYPGAAILAAAGFHKTTRSSPQWPRLASMMNLPTRL
jgi:TolB-like protein/Tfp pilus assembly protein PilF